MRTANRLLGYPDDARLLIINGDDLGLDACANAGVAQAITCGVACSTSLMVPCPGAAGGLRWLAARSEVSFGLHITLVRDSRAHLWPPLSPPETIPSLLGPEGQYHLHDGSHRLPPGARLPEVEAETRAQIEAVLSAGLRPAHLDWHCLLDGGREDVFELTLGLAREYGLALRVAGGERIGRLQRMGLPTADRAFLDSFSLPPGDKPARYLQLLRDLPEGLSEWALHPAADAGETLRDAPDRAVRAADLAFLTSEAAREAVSREGIVLLDYRPLQAAWRGAPAPGQAGA